MNGRRKMKTVQGIKTNDTFVSINSVALNKEDISSFSWNEKDFQIQVFMKSGYEHSFHFENGEAMAEAIFKLNG
jgi:predicted transcriptional regulator